MLQDNLYVVVSLCGFSPLLMAMREPFPGRMKASKTQTMDDWYQNGDSCSLDSSIHSRVSAR